MYHCQNCPTLVPPRQSMNKVTVERRKKTYEKPIKRNNRVVDVELVEGWEIAKEIVVCPQCYTTLTGKEVSQVVVPAVEKEDRPQPQRFFPRQRRRFNNDRRNNGGFNNGFRDNRNNNNNRNDNRSGQGQQRFGQRPQQNQQQRNNNNNWRNNNQQQQQPRKSPVVQVVNPLPIVK